MKQPSKCNTAQSKMQAGKFPWVWLKKTTTVIAANGPFNLRVGVVQSKPLSLKYCDYIIIDFIK